MKKLLLTLVLATSGLMTQAQVIVSGVSPAPIQGNYEFTWARPTSGWSTPNFLVSGTYITGELMVVNDGISGTSPTGHPYSEYGCAGPLSSLAGKIAVVYRFDGVSAQTAAQGYCGFADKALAAQNAGAIGVIIINRDNLVIAMGAGTAGSSVTIPVVMLSSNDGAALRAEMLNGPVTMFIGNKTGLFNDDAGVSGESSLISKTFGVPSQLAQNGTEFNFEVGTRVYNYGILDQTDVTVIANIDGPSGLPVYTNTVGPISILSGDSIDIFPGGTYSFPQFSLGSYPPGRYTLTYTVTLGTPDNYDADNVYSSDFVINDSIFSYAKLDAITGLPVSNNGYRPSTNNNTFATCMVIDNPNASRIGVAGIYFSASTSTTSGVSLLGEEMSINLYRWDDSFFDLNDAGLGFNSLNSVAFGYYDYTADLQGEMVYGALSTPVVLTNNQRYLACVQTVNVNVYLGHDTKTNYLWNEAQYLQPISPNESDGTYYASGFGVDAISAMGLRIFDAALLGVNEEESVEGIVYPNPASNSVTVSLKADGNANLSVTDVTGKTALQSTLTLVNGKSEVNISSLEAGVYFFNVTLDNGKTAQYRVVKK